MDMSGMDEMKQLMENWKSGKRKREKEEIAVGLLKAGNIVVEPVTVEGTVVARVKRKFDKSGADPDTNHDFDTWKRRRTCVPPLTVGTGVDTGLREQGTLEVGDETEQLGVDPSRDSEKKEKGFKLKLITENNHVNSSKLGEGISGVQRGGTGQGGGGVTSGQYSTKQQRDSKRLGSLFVSAEISDNAAAAVGKQVLLGVMDSTKYVE